MSVMKKIWVAVLVLGAITSLLYGLGVFRSAAPPELVMGMRAVVSRETGKPVAMPTFAFSAPIKISSVRVYNAEEYASQGELAVPLWALAGAPMSDALREFTYGLPIRKMKPETKGAKPLPLYRDHQYRMILKTDRGTYDKPFVYAEKQAEATGQP